MVFEPALVSISEIRVFNYNSLEKAHEFEARAKRSAQTPRLGSTEGTSDQPKKGPHGLHSVHRGASDPAVSLVLLG